MESYPSNVACVPIKRHDWVRVCRFDIVKLDIVMTGRRQVTFIGCDAEAIHLRIRMLDGARADARQRFPEAVPYQLALTKPTSY